MSIKLKLIKAPIKFYRSLISPLLGNHCRFHPTCSAYALEALDKHGLLKGCILTFFRIIKCNPWSHKSLIDPVPTRFTYSDCFGYKKRHKKNAKGNREI